MEKVSRIIPSNARIETVDMAGVKPGRNKLPGIDRENVKPTARLEGSELTAVDRLSKSENFRIPKPDEARHTEIAKKINQDFFSTYNKKADLVNKNETEIVSRSSPQGEGLKMNNLAKNISETEDVDEVQPRAKIIDLTPEKETSIVKSALESKSENEQNSFSKYA